MKNTNVSREFKELEAEVEKLKSQLANVNRHNGWSNYETWRVYLEVFDNPVWQGFKTSPDELKEYVETMIDCCIPTEFKQSDSRVGQIYAGIVKGWTNAFISEVNWYEIAKHLNGEDEL